MERMPEELFKKLDQHRIEIYGEHGEKLLKRYRDTGLTPDEIAEYRKTGHTPQGTIKQLQILKMYKDTGLTPDEIIALQAENAALLAGLKHEGDCEKCIHYRLPGGSEKCKPCLNRSVNNWEWRGTGESGGKNG